jgi:hypothetical protein
MQYLFSKSEVMQLEGDTPNFRGTKSTNAIFKSTIRVATRARPSCKGTAAEGRAAITIAVVAVTWNCSRRTTIRTTKASAALVKEVQILIFSCQVAEGSGFGIWDKEGRRKNQEGKKENERSAHVETLFLLV